MMQLAPASCGTKDLDIFITKHFQICRTWYYMPSISLCKNEICKGCMLGKNIKKMFPSSDIKAQGILDLVHSDV